jgi:hypothetical protein
MTKLSSIILVFLFFPYFVGACMFANQGEEYDELIKIEKLESTNEYRFSLPRIVGESSGWPTLTLIYSSHEMDPDCKDETLPDGTEFICMPKDQIQEELVINNFFGKTIDLLSNKKLYEAEFKIKDKNKYSVELSVMWETEVCLTFGRKNIIE